MKMSATPFSSPEKLLASLEEPRKSQLKELDAFIRKTVPSLAPFVMGNMLSYGPYRYVYASGREGDWAVVLLASQKNYISLYVCAVSDGKYLAESYKDKLPKTSIGKSCIRFKKLEDLDLTVLAKLLKEAARWKPDFPKKKDKA